MLFRKWALTICITSDLTMKLELTFCSGTCLRNNGMASQCYGTHKGTHQILQCSLVHQPCGVQGSLATEVVQFSLISAATDLFHCSKGTSSSSGVVAAALYASQWSGKIVTFRVDNIAVVEATAPPAGTATLCTWYAVLIFLASYHNFWFTASHIEGKQNTSADELSRNNMILLYRSHRLHKSNQRAGHPTDTKSVLDIPSLGFSRSTLLLSCASSMNHKDI